MCRAAQPPRHWRGPQVTSQRRGANDPRPLPSKPHLQLPGAYPGPSTGSPSSLRSSQLAMPRVPRQCCFQPATPCRSGNWRVGGLDDERARCLKACSTCSWRSQAASRRARHRHPDVSPVALPTKVVPLRSSSSIAPLPHWNSFWRTTDWGGVCVCVGGERRGARCACWGQDRTRVLPSIRSDQPWSACVGPCAPTWASPCLTAS